MTYSLTRRLVAEGLGSALLLAVVVGSGVMGERLSAGNDAIALLGNTLSTGAALVVLISVLGPISGAHFNPVVTLVMAARRALSPGAAVLYVCIQTIGAVLGVMLAHAMFGEPLIQVSEKLREGPAQTLSEAVATFGLVATILGVSRFRPDFTPMAVGLYITAAYWFTASTSFANPAVTLARSLTDTFAGIAPASVPGFLLGQAVGAILAALFIPWLLTETPAHDRT
ncbi:MULTISPECIES: MIP/aquaporin family protein [unclassified Caulobacter]|uniref:MIP/aquaporin family protein n=1 Tax=unclassified Caulobacter TaxID=2648921 RepID=UPI000D3D1420|nr:MULTISPECIES: MIP/aquaporin family protein [unclassified Caulobacter]PTS88427.1 aquaporin family protein [Caulobacter sp. HMWF009]PTT07355.1 aquaporin family protein [Caulobacter sp. HMWF025]